MRSFSSDRFCGTPHEVFEFRHDPTTSQGQGFEGAHGSSCNTVETVLHEVLVGVR